MDGQRSVDEEQSRCVSREREGARCRGGNARKGDGDGGSVRDRRFGDLLCPDASVLLPEAHALRMEDRHPGECRALTEKATLGAPEVDLCRCDRLLIRMDRSGSTLHRSIAFGTGPMCLRTRNLPGCRLEGSCQCLRCIANPGQRMACVTVRDLSVVQKVLLAIIAGGTLERESAL